MPNITIFRWPSEAGVITPACKTCFGRKHVTTKEFGVDRVLGRDGNVLEVFCDMETWCPECCPEKALQPWYECDTCQDTGRHMGAVQRPWGYSEVDVHCIDCAEPHKRGRACD